MYRLLFISVVLSTFFSCKNQKKAVVANINSVIIEPIFQDSLLNVRALEVHKSDVFIATSHGETFVLKEDSERFKEIFEKDTLHKPNFRALACTSNSVFTISIANPGVLYKDGVLVYKEVHESVFYDAIEFWNDQEGIAIGDTTDDCLSIIITRDGGDSWQKLPCDTLPKGNFGAFAASDTNITVIGNHAWVATGGKISQVLFSADKGKTWAVQSTPIIQGLDTTGIYSIAFYDENIGFAIGGDYTKPDDNQKNKIRTTDGGKTWQLVADGVGPGYRSCVQFIPNGNGEKLVALGVKGIDYSDDFGETWNHLNNDSFYTLRFMNDSLAFAAGKGRVAKLTFGTN